MLAVFALAAAGLSLAWALAPGAKGADGAAALNEQLNQARGRLLQWYGGQLVALDAGAGFPLSPAQVLSAAGLDASPALRFAAGPLALPAAAAGGAAAGSAPQSSWPARPLALWISPGPDDASRFDASGRFLPDSRLRAWRLFSSEPLERAAWARAEARLRTLAAMAELRASIRLRADPDHDLQTNPFRAANCQQPLDEFPCTPALPAGTGAVPPTVAWFAAHTTAFGNAFSRAEDTPALQEPDALASNPWGAPNRVDNTPQPGAPPHAMRFSTETPGGVHLEVVAVQPLD